MGDPAGALATLGRPVRGRSNRRPSISISGVRRWLRWGVIRRRWWPSTSGRWRWSQGIPAALFGLALENDRRGNDEGALRLYERAVRGYPSHVGALLNLGIMYEDTQRYEQAQSCYRRILDSLSQSPPRRLYFKDAVASSDMFYDEEAQKRNDRLNQVLSISVNDFELSVRSRNCLQKMGIRTLGDLTRTTELELLASKNFGETSLVEIRDMLRFQGIGSGAIRSPAA